MKLGEFIKSYRDKTKLTMQEFADRAGLSKGYISMLEKNQHPQSQRPLTPSLETYQKVASAASLTLDELITLLDGDETVRLAHPENEYGLSNSSDECETNSIHPLSTLTDPERKLLNNYRQLNAEGQAKLSEYADDLVDTGKYIKSDQNKMANTDPVIPVDPFATLRKPLPDEESKEKVTRRAFSYNATK